MDKHSVSLLILCLFVMGGASGCTMCQPCELDSFSAYGGRWHRTDRTHGRVASVFQPAGAQVPYSEDELAPTEMVPADAATEELESDGSPTEETNSDPNLEVDEADESLREASLIDEMLGQNY